MQCDVMPMHGAFHIADPVGDYLKTELVATCENCYTRSLAEKPINYFRVKVPRGTVMCPNCRNVLFWERIKLNERQQNGTVASN